ncbi:MAG TPA: ABC transporter ATP-binding protein [Candidatus Faecousia intestinigallinarum]|nr:ABC transporter ATP-binding protein [Candidatus Faecousia intestinigallinarum]
MAVYQNDRLNSIPYLFHSVTCVVGDLVMLTTMSPWLVLAAVATASLPLLAMKPLSALEGREKAKYSKLSESYTGTLKETIEGYESIRTAGASEPLLQRHVKASQRRQKGWIRLNIVSTMSHSALMKLGSFANMVCLVVGGYLVTKGVLAASLLFAASSYFTSLSNHFNNITEYLVEIRASKPIVEKLLSQRDFPCTPPSNHTLQRPLALEYQGISFGFGQRQLYSGFSCTFAPGGCYAILGESGSGKSTLTKLLLKYFDGYTGTISLGGHDIRELSEEEIYAQVGLVAQSPFLFNTSLYENITLFSHNLDQDSQEYLTLLADLNLTALAQRVGDTPLGDFGDNISGGERQRIQLARVMATHPAIVIFDEPTTGLDPENISLINEFIFRCQDITRIVITHNWDKTFLNRFDQVVTIGREIPVA